MTVAAVRYETVIGLEVHVELSTESKMFCGCPARFGGEPNTHVCPVCLGLPGVLPVPNRRAVEYAVRAALALNCRIAEESKFDRKNYHYPDLPKNYQISQYDQPLARDGFLTIRTHAGEKRVRIRRLHLEEDAGKSLHEGGTGSLLDFNRAGVPLMEIVSEPDLSSPEEARLYLEKLRLLMLYVGVSDVRMEEGSLRCDANISLRPEGSREYGALVEIKNVNSFRSLQRALEYEVERQTVLLLAGERVVRETRHWDEGRGVTVASRSKEEAHDYRYFPEPDLVPMTLDRAWVEEIRASLPELPDARFRRYAEEWGLPPYDAGVLVENPDLAGFLDAAVAAGARPRAAASWVTVELQGRLNAAGITVAEAPVRPEHLASLLGLVEEGALSGRMAKDVFEEMFRTGKPPAAIVAARGLRQISDEDALRSVVAEVVAANPQAVADYRGGKKAAIGFLVGQVMKATRGQASPELANRLLREVLGD